MFRVPALARAVLRARCAVVPVRALTTLTTQHRDTAQRFSVASGMGLLVGAGALATLVADQAYASPQTDAAPNSGVPHVTVPSTKPKKSFSDEKISTYEDRLRFFSAPDKVFRYFATIKIGDTVYMRPSDFVRAITPGHLQPKGLGLDLFDAKPRSYGHVHDASKAPTLFSHSLEGDLDEEHVGLISYPEYLFLVTALTIPVHQFEVAFKMFDLDGNGIVDMDEFKVVQKALQRTTPTGRRVHYMDTSGVSRDDLGHSLMLQTFFGHNGRDKLTFDKFAAFVNQVQQNVLHLEFLRYKTHPDPEVTSEIGFARMLLHYARLDKSKRPQYYQRVHTAFDANPVGIPFRDVVAFYELLRRLDDLEQALSLYHFAGVPVTERDFRRAAKAVNGVELSEHLVHTLFVLFDNDGDGELNDKEFVHIMKEASARGLNRGKDLGFARGFDGLLQCVKQQLHDTTTSV
eukprot:m.765278 g.765278  ORF g.765278 m.765278 type:complete len:460 (-) comp59059_c1_seq3:1941-3320(-)